MPARWIALTCAVAAVLVGRGCGGSTRSWSRRTGPSSGAVGPADPAAMRVLLARFAPIGQRVLTTLESLPGSYAFGPTTITVRHAKDFDDYIPDGDPAEAVEHLGTAVHEVYHALTTRWGYALLAASGATAEVDCEAVFVGGEPLLVRYSAHVPSRAMDPTFPSDARTSRYATYISPSGDGQGTQVDGVFGLLDEWAAYFHSTRVYVDLWPWVRDEAPASEQVLVNYTARLHEAWVPYAEFKLFILHYLAHARAHAPAIYAGLIDNADFRRAFTATDAAWTALLTEAAALEPTVHAFARGRGVGADLQGGELTFEGHPFHVRDAAYPAVLAALAGPPYVEIAAALAAP